MQRPYKITLGGLLVLVIATGCASGETGTRTLGTDDRFGNADPIGPGTGSGDPGGPVAGSGPGGGDPLANGECAREVTEANARPLTIYTLFDDSGSMFPWWIPVTQAFIKFVYDPRSDGINVGLKYFGSECSAATYASPDIPIGAIGPGRPNAMMIEASLGFHLPISGTATLPAVEGGLMAAQAHAEAHPDEAVILLLVTDGAPDDCNSTVDNVAQAAMAGVAGDPRVPMYVLGLGDINGLNALSQAGGTGEALVADPNMIDQVVEAINEIRSSALPCDYLPPGAASPDSDRINLEFTASEGGSPVVVPRVSDQDACAAQGGGWFADAGRMVACEQTCRDFKATVDGRVDVVLGCPTVEVR